MKGERGICPVCGNSILIRAGGQLRSHRNYLPQRLQDTSTRLGRTVVCSGSGRLPA